MNQRFWIGVLVGAAAAWWFGVRGFGVGGAGSANGAGRVNRATRYSGLGRFGAR